MVREFSLLNEKNQIFSLMDIENYCLLTEPSGLGISYDSEYERLGNTFISNFKKVQQGSINGILNFKNYDNYRRLVDFIEKAEFLKILYKVPYNTGTKTYYRDVEIDSLEKSEVNYESDCISEPVLINCLSLWYEPTNLNYTVEPETNEVRWDFTWDGKFVSYDARELTFINDGHVPATIDLEIDGDVLNPKLELYVEGQLVQEFTITNQISEFQILKYSSKENGFYIKKQLENGTEQNLFSLDYLNFNEDPVLRLPIGKNCKIKMSADNEILSARLTIYVYYKAV